MDRAKNENHEGFHLINVLYKLGCYFIVIVSIRSEKFIFNVILNYVPLRSSVAYDLNILNFLTWHWVIDLSAEH